MLLFKKKFLDAIRDGTKTQTVRLWNVCRFRAGQRSYIPGVGYIWIDAVDTILVEDLTDDDAQLDGFSSAEALRTELRTLYAEQLAAGHQAYRVRFRRMNEEESRAVKTAKIPARRTKRTGP